jgi:hypothetical protein
MKTSKPEDQYSDVEIAKRLDKALHRSLQLPPPQRGEKAIRMKKVKPSTSRRRARSA